jgi:hypothetical protein
VETINKIFRQRLISRHTKTQIYKTLAIPPQSYGSKAWTVRRNDERMLMSTEMHFVRRTAGCNLWDHERNEEITKELHT